MLFANQVVGNHIFHCEFKESAVLRNHEKPDGKKWEALAEFVEELGIEFDGSSAGALYKTIQRAKAKYGPQVGQTLELLAMKGGMKPATYFRVGTGIDPHHFALNFDFYTHFTSPIRRYPDVLVHRCLAESLDPTKVPKDEDDPEQQEHEALIEELCKRSNEYAIFSNYFLSSSLFSNCEETIFGHL